MYFKFFRQSQAEKIYQPVFSAAEADLFGVFQRMQAVAGLDTADKRLIALRLPHKVDAGLVQRHRVGGGENADVVDIRLGRVAVAVTVHGKAVHDVDVDDVLFAHMVAHGGHHFAQGLQPGVLIAVHDAAACTGPGGMDIDLAAGRGHADGHILDRAAEARHGVALEMGQDQPVGIILRVAADDGVLQTPAARDGPLHLALFIHEVEVGKGSEAVFRRHLLMQGGACAGAAVGGVALDDRAADGLHQRGIP